ncbi:MAG: hypothetical protein K2J64_01695 [Desulfovibrio sp.]|nr:hypothetical protein [Desulfovibrio sp.]
MGTKNASGMIRNARRDGRPEAGTQRRSSDDGVSFGKGARMLVIGTTGAGTSDMAFLPAFAGVAAMQAPRKGSVQD